MNQRKVAASLAVLVLCGLAANASRPEPARADGGAIASALLKETGKGLLSKGAGIGVGYALTAMGIGAEAETAAALAEIKAQLVRVNTQLTTLRTETSAIQRDVLQSDYNGAARQAEPIIASIDHAEKLLREAAALPAGRHQRTLAHEASEYIKAHLLDKTSLLATLAFGGGPASATSIYTAAFKARTADHFLSHEDSVLLRYLVDYYTGYEAAATQLAVTYYVTVADYPREVLAQRVDQTAQSVERQLAARKDAVPPGSVIDTRTELQWWTKGYGLTQHPAAISGAFAFSLFLFNVSHETKVGGWTMPTRDQMEGLISGWNDRPDSWLAKNAGFKAPMEEGEGSQKNPEFWTSTLVSAGVVGTTLPPVYSVMDMRNGDIHHRFVTGHYSQHGFMAVRVPHRGAYLP